MQNQGDKSMTHMQDSQPMKVLTHTTTFFLAGCFAIQTMVSFNTSKQCTDWPITVWITIITGVILILAAVALVVTTFPYKWLECYKNIMHKWSLWLYPILFGITLSEVLQVLLESLNMPLLLISSIVFLGLICLAIILTAKSVFQSANSMIILAVTLNIISIFQVISMSPNFLDPTKLVLAICLTFSTIVLIVSSIKLTNMEKKP